jgi:hypothetical protein
VASSGKCQLEQRDKVSDRVLVESSLYRKCWGQTAPKCV